MRTKVMTFAGILLAAVLMGGCETEWQYVKQSESAAVAKAQEHILFIREPRSGICFAYLYQEKNPGRHSSTGGPALATVDCERVNNLLVVMPEAR